MTADGVPGGGRTPHRAKRSLGQNFLIDPNIQRRIVDALEPSLDDVVLEIGPGRVLAGKLRERLLRALRIHDGGDV